MADSRFKVDKNLPSEVVEQLRRVVSDALSIHDRQMVGTSDDTITEICQRERRAIVTLDTDFANIQISCLPSDRIRYGLAMGMVRLANTPTQALTR